jgi:hypothetical protein
MSDRPKTWPTKVRVSQFPDRQIEVDEAEYNNLSAQGLLVDLNATDAKATRAGVSTNPKE